MSKEILTKGNYKIVFIRVVLTIMGMGIVMVKLTSAIVRMRNDDDDFFVHVFQQGHFEILPNQRQSRANWLDQVSQRHTDISR